MKKQVKRFIRKKKTKNSGEKQVTGVVIKNFPGM